MSQAHIAFGGNLGDVEDNLRNALEALEHEPDIRITRISSLYRTAPVGVEDQPEFVNGALEVDTSLPPLDLLRRLLEIENQCGRVRALRWGPRTVDLDLLLYGERVERGPVLEVPHPRMHERAFVLVPLAEVAPHAIHPELGLSVAELVVQLGTVAGVVRIGRPAWLEALERRESTWD